MDTSDSRSAESQSVVSGDRVKLRESRDPCTPPEAEPVGAVQSRHGQQRNLLLYTPFHNYTIMINKGMLNTGK